MSAETCEGTVDFKMRNGKAKIVRSGEISKTIRLTQSKESFENQFLTISKLWLNSEKFQNFQFKPKFSFLRENHEIINRMNFWIRANSPYIIYIGYIF